MGGRRPPHDGHLGRRPADVRLRRGLQRDGAEATGDWERLGREEDAHFVADRTRDRADVIVDGAPTIPHEPEVEFVRLR